MDQIIKDLLNDNWSESLVRSLFIIRSHIEYCKRYNIDMSKDPLLSKVLLFR